MFPYTLDQEISKRQTLNQKFTEQELWYLLYQLLIGSSAFQKKRQKSGDIRPRNILINDLGHVNLINVLSFPDEITNYYKSLLQKVPTFLGNFIKYQSPGITCIIGKQSKVLQI